MIIIDKSTFEWSEVKFISFQLKIIHAIRLVTDRYEFQIMFKLANINIIKIYNKDFT